MNVKPTSHPSAEVLAAYGLGKLKERDLATIAQHLQGCPQCRQAVERGRADRSTASGTQLPATVALKSVAASKAVPAATPVAELPPELVNHAKFRILKELGRGGMGVVYQAEHRIMEKIVALKVISRTLLSHPEALERFHREVRAAAKLEHPHIVRALDADSAGELHLLVMEFIEGVSLFQTVQQKGALPVTHACHYVRQAALGLQYAHEQGMVHRDIKPHNLMLTPRGQVKILDFGLARLASEQKGEGGLTRSGDFMGTPEYVAPEQATDASQADIRADIYSLGCTLYFLLTGRPPFQEGQAIQTILAHLQKEPPPLSQLRSDLPAELWPVAARMLAKDPAQRYQTPLEVAEALASFCKAGPRSPVAPSLLNAPSGASPTQATVLPDKKGPSPSKHPPGGADQLDTVAASPLAGASPFAGIGDLTRSPAPKNPDRKPWVPAGKTRVWLAVAVGAVLLVGLAVLWTGGGSKDKPGNATGGVSTDKPGKAMPVLENRPANAEVKIVESKLYLHDLKEFDCVAFRSSTVWAPPSGITVKGERFTKGLWMHPRDRSDASVKYRLDGLSACVFQAKVAINDSARSGSATPLAFQVFGDGKVLWTSRPVQAPRQTDDCSVKVEGIRVLELRVVCPGSHGSAHAVWLDPYLLSKK